MKQGQKVTVRARVSKIVYSSHSNSVMVVIEDVFVDGNVFRDHCWIRQERRLSSLKKGDMFTATAKVNMYFNSSSGKSDKVGFKDFRSIELQN